jgi:hypothetical protein
VLGTYYLVFVVPVCHVGLVPRRPVAGLRPATVTCLSCVSDMSILYTSAIGLRTFNCYPFISLQCLFSASYACFSTPDASGTLSVPVACSRPFLWSCCLSAASGVSWLDAGSRLSQSRGCVCFVAVQVQPQSVVLGSLPCLVCPYTSIALSSFPHSVHVLIAFGNVTGIESSCLWAGKCWLLLYLGHACPVCSQPIFLTSVCSRLCVSAPFCLPGPQAMGCSALLFNTSLCRSASLRLSQIIIESHSYTV